MSKSSFAERLLLRWALPGLLLAALLGQATRYWELPGLATLERQLFDLRVRLTAPAEPDPRIVIIDIDERSLAALGRWPWKRSLLADLLEKVFDRQGALLAGMDLILAEPDDSSGLASLDALARGPLHDDERFAAQLQRLRPALDHDTRLAQVLQTHPVVLGFHGSNRRGAVASGALPAPASSAAGFGQPQADKLPNWSGYGASLPQLQQAATGAGFLNVPNDPDGVARRAPLLSVIGDQVYASLPLALMQTLSGATGLQPRLGAVAGGVAAPLVGLALQTPHGELRVATDAQSAVLLPYRRDRDAYQHVSAVDVLQDKIAPDALRRRIVLLGASAPGLQDRHTTPLGDDFPGLTLHASVLSGLLDGRLASVPAYTPALEAGQLLAVALVLTLALPRLSLGRGLLLGGALAAALVAVNFLAYTQAREAWPLASALLLVAALLGLHLLYAYFVEHRTLRQLSALFGQYVPAELVQQMSRQPERYTMASRNAELSVLFADVHAFTGIAERLTPEELSLLMHEFFTSMTEIVQAHGGTLDKYMGDALMAFWGAPVAAPGHALQATGAALAMQRALEALNRRFVARGWPALSVNIGINSGTMVVGDLGSRQRRAYTVLGDAVNLAARLQQLCSERELGLLISETTRERIGTALPCEELGELQLRGRAAPVRVFRIATTSPRNLAIALP
ncbi:adenylate/guanylate cyclase domain-containing protein [Paucibacter sp. R3-3]|uniref:Adenylate/guanylate cyclase domain-containing protein n=1 Tax=Roseateles agri TaxID=3098619 RepID=A0ABU5DC94_9BURK|nr:adenylate/guanylate cyclase domain-containing protein [Paucibacter sp. R3-3]MDY0743754.1 adenylate/guanylate cyclase domain-containing protein [Paucibacter sp. R3-3]